MQMIILLIDERPEEVTDIKEYIEGNNVEVIYSTFDETPEHHKRVSEMVCKRFFVFHIIFFTTFSYGGSC